MPVREKPMYRDFFNLDERALGVIAERYGLDDVDCFLPVLLDGDRATLLETRSETAKKAVVDCGDARYFLKQIPWYCDTEQQVAFSTQLQTQLARQGIPVPRIIPTRQGCAWTSIGTGKYVLTAFVSGRRYDGSERHLRSAARQLAAMHTTMIDAGGALGEDVFTLTGEHIRLLATVAGNRGQDVTAVLSAYRQRLAEAHAAAAVAGWATLPRTPVHGDYNPWNLLFDGAGQVAALLDFDNCDKASRLHDVAEALLTFGVLRYSADSTTFAAEQATEPNINQLRQFLSAYQELSTLDAIELACLPHVMTAVYIELTCLGLIREDFQPDQLPRLRHTLDALHDVLDDALTVAGCR